MIQKSVTLTDDGVKAVFEDGRRVLEITVTHEGMILDAYDDTDDGRIHGTMGAMAEEWWDYLTTE